MRWLVSQTDDIFSQEEVRNSRFAVKYLIPPVPVEINHQFIAALRRDLTRNLGGTQKTVFDVLRLSLDAIIERADNLMARNRSGRDVKAGDYQRDEPHRGRARSVW